MKKMKEILKIIFGTILLTTTTIWAFGGGCLYWVGFCMVVGIEGAVAEWGFYISAFVLAIFSWWISPKIADKIL